MLPPVKEFFTGTQTSDINKIIHDFLLAISLASYMIAYYDSMSIPIFCDCELWTDVRAVMLSMPGYCFYSVDSVQRDRFSFRLP